MKFLKKNLMTLACLIVINQSAQTMEFADNNDDETSLPRNKIVITPKIEGGFEIRNKIIGEQTLRALADPERQKYRSLSLHTCGLGSGQPKYSLTKVSENAMLLVPFLKEALLNQTEIESLCLAENVRMTTILPC